MARRLADSYEDCSFHTEDMLHQMSRASKDRMAGMGCTAGRWVRRDYSVHCKDTDWEVRMADMVHIHYMARMRRMVNNLRMAHRSTGSTESRRAHNTRIGVSLVCLETSFWSGRMPSGLCPGAYLPGGTVPLSS